MPGPLDSHASRRHCRAAAWPRECWPNMGGSAIVYAAAREIAPSIAGFTVVVTKSTVPVGTGDEVERIIREARPDADVALVSNPGIPARRRRDP